MKVVLHALIHAVLAFAIAACADGASAGPAPERAATPASPPAAKPNANTPAPAESKHAVDAVPGKKSATPPPAAEPARPSTDPAVPQSSPPVSVQRSKQMMGTMIQMTSLGVPEAQAGPVLEAALAEMQRLEGLLSEWRPDSDVSRVNAAAGDHPVQVGPELIDNIRVALQVARWSDGAFDLSWAALRGMYLFQPGQERVPTDQELKERLKFVGYKDIVFDEKKSTVFLRRKGMSLGLGGIAKGYALEKAANLLRDGGVQNYMIFGGGQVLVNGMKGDRAWRVGVQHPRLNDYFGFVQATSGSIATSGDYEHAFVRDGVRWHHIIDLKTGRPVTHTSSVTVVSESAFYADAIDTALFIMGPKKALAKLPSAPGPKAEVLIVGSDMKVYMSPGMQQRLIIRANLQDGKLPLSQAELR
jgi:FAD:protein FMN transferase